MFRFLKYVENLTLDSLYDTLFVWKKRLKYIG